MNHLPQETSRRARTTVPTQLAALAAGVTEATIRKWASRGKLTRHGRPGRAEYDLEELYELVVESRRRNTVR
ncbi:MerR family transcriptional regulator [Actinophytocola xinjiangensis]|uniref:MerR family transcriptional regulator n=1 Tax=Actinophytocola xinjiangensis TaxID=485602 RepID=A0A7Z0WRJ9_9PSEU|nr:MerR family transcriptional regulator [Actinophytocola xinjiangensis]OLF13005.1 MerR family transcriptional regulator [Actinophytocola xinjiangensis]